MLDEKELYSTKFRFSIKKYFLTYHKFGIFPVNVKYKTLEGYEGSASIACFNRISKANYSADYDVEGKDMVSKQKTDHLEGIARRSGFRINRIETPNGFRLIFFGETQKKVNEFVEICSLPDFSLFTD